MTHGLWLRVGSFMTILFRMISSQIIFFLPWQR